MFGKIKVFGWLMVSVFLLAITASPEAADIEEHITKTESGFYYTVQKGDTLWDLSEKFADSPWEWPELWHYNPDIKNPHWIYPGQKILIYKKEWAGKAKAAATEEKVAGQEPKVFYHYEMINSVGFVRETVVPPSGTIFNATDDKTLVSENDTVYIRPGDGPELETGQLYTIYRTFETGNPARKIDSEGIQHYLTGLVEVTEIQDEYAIAKVTHAFRDIHYEDMVMPFTKRAADIEPKEAVPGLTGKVIQSEERNVLIGQYKLVFIDKGANDGVEVGQSYNIYHQPVAALKKGEKPIGLKPINVGELLVLHTEDTTATGLIISSTKPIRPDDLIMSAK